MATIKQLQARADKAWDRIVAAQAKIDEVKIAVFAHREQWSLLMKQQKHWYAEQAKANGDWEKAITENSTAKTKKKKKARN